MERQNATKYPSKVSSGLVILIFLLVYGPLIPAILKSPDGKITVTIVIATLVLLFVLYHFYNTVYTIDKNKLQVRCGLFSYRPIPIDAIKVVTRTNSIISAPASSFDRIQIDYLNDKSIVISPKDKRRFINDMRQINPNIINKTLG